MLKRIAAIMLTLAMVFGIQSAVFAATDYVEATSTQQSEVIRLAENPQLAALNEDLQLLNATGFGGMKIEPWFWLLSIVIPGLGQFLMGDTVKGIMFFLANTIIGILYTASAVILTSLGLGAVAGVVGIILPLILLGVYLWNIYDAYMMSGQTMGMSSIDTEKVAADIQKIAEFAQKNQLVASANNGIGVDHMVAAF
jgi:TM2 domain-containing membrane protein YozV